MAAAGTPGVNPGPFGFGFEVTTSGGPNSGPPNGPVVRSAHGSGLPGRGRPSGGGVYEHGEPLSTAGPGCSGVPSSGVGPGAGAPFGNRCPLGSGNLQAGRPASPQNFSGSMPRFLNAESTCSLRLPRTPAILLALASSCLTWSSRLPMVSENLATPSSAADRCG